VLPDAQRKCGGVQFYFSQLTNLLVIANSSLNVVIYLTFNTRFRQVRASVSHCRVNLYRPTLITAPPRGSRINQSINQAINQLIV